MDCTRRTFLGAVGASAAWPVLAAAAQTANPPVAAQPVIGHAVSARS